MLRHYDSVHSSSHDFKYTVLMEIGESAVMLGAFGASQMFFGSNPLAGVITNGTALLLAGAVDYAMDKMREEKGGIYHWEKTFTLLSDERDQGNLSLQAMKFILTNGLGDKMFYTAFALSYSKGIDPSSLVGFIAFPGRNAISRASWSVASRVMRGCCGKGEKLITYEPGEDRAIYVSSVDESKAVAFTYVAAARQKRRINGLWKAKQESPSLGAEDRDVVLSSRRSSVTPLTGSGDVQLQLMGPVVPQSIIRANSSYDDDDFKDDIPPPKLQ